MRNRGFTLIEMAIVLVIIGLLIGGVLVGRDLMSAAAVRSQITQIEKYNQATNTFYGKYGQLPGDADPTTAARFGLVARGVWPTNCPSPASGTSCPGEGDGNGVIEGANWQAYGSGLWQEQGETLTYWIDLANTGLIADHFTTRDETIYVGAGVTNFSNLYPPAKIGNGNYMYVWSYEGASVTYGMAPYTNYLGLSTITSMNPNGAQWGFVSQPGLTVAQAAAIDSKIDDGFPQTGNVIAEYLTLYLGGATSGGGVWPPVWAAGGAGTGTSNSNATPGTSTTCYDNGGVAGIQKYSITQNNGSGVNCALSFQFK